MTWTVAGYAVEQLVGQGASGEVWRGRGIVDGEVVALKRLAVEDAVALRSAQAEAAVLASFEHPHILRMRELLISEGEAILVTDFAHGGSLAEVIEHRGRLSPAEVVTVVAPIAAALAHAHAEGVVHGDVSAANILFTAAGLPLLADLGVARIVGQVDGGARATPLYVDPLVARGGASGPHSDVFSLAAVAWHALTGSAPWAGESIAESLGLAADGGLPPIATALPSIPAGLGAALDRALQDDGILRGSAAELALDSRHAVEPIPVDGWTARPTVGPSRGRHCAQDEPRSGSRAAATGSGATPLSPTGRPAFRRAEPPPQVSPTARTRSARHQAAPEAPRDGARLRPRSGSRPPAAAAGRARPGERGRAQAMVAPAGSRRRWGLALLTAAAVLASVAAGGWWAQRDARRADGGGPAVRPLAQTTAAVGPAQSAQGEAQWLAELARVDAVRARAYATGDATLLAQVYSSPSLLAQDRAQLAGQVPAGCGLEGATTQYSALDLHAAGPETARLTVTATLDAAQLTCAGGAPSSSPQIGPVRLAVSLSCGVDGIWRIDDQRLAG